MKKDLLTLTDILALGTNWEIDLDGDGEMHVTVTGTAESAVLAAKRMLEEMEPELAEDEDEDGWETIDIACMPKIEDITEVTPKFAVGDTVKVTENNPDLSTAIMCDEYIVQEVTETGARLNLPERPWVNFSHLVKAEERETFSEGDVVEVIKEDSFESGVPAGTKDIISDVDYGDKTVLLSFYDAWVYMADVKKL